MKRIKSRNVRVKNAKAFKIMMCLVVGGVLFYCSRHASAKMNDSLLEKNRVDGVYAVAVLDGVERIFYLNMYEMNDRVSYCIELGVDITTEIYHSTNDFTVSYLSDEQVDYIRAISYFGYGYEGHADYRYYMASQELIWEYLGNTNVEWTNELRSDGNRINIEAYKEGILNLIENDKRVLDFGWEEGQAFKIGKEIILTDANEILDNYEVISAKYSDVSISGNNLIIKVGNAIGEEVIKLSKKNYYDYDSLLYYYDSSQRLISSGNYERDEEEISFNIKGVSLKGVVVDSSLQVNMPRGEGVLNGSVYEVYDDKNNLIGTYKSNANGEFFVSNLISGTYYIKQVEASCGYLVNNNVFKVKVNNDNVEIKLEQEVISNNIEIMKVYGEDGEYKPENNITFVVYNSNDRFHSYLFTRDGGRVKFNLSYGTYRIHQVNTTFGYSMVDDFYIDVRNHSTDVIYYNLVDELVRVNVRVNAFGSLILDELLVGDFSYRIREKGKNTYIEYDGNSVFSSDNGEVLPLVLLPYGDYILEQVSVPDGVILSDDVYEFSIDENSKLDLINDKLVVDINVSNKLVTGRVNVSALEEVFYKDVNNYGYDFKVRDEVEFSLVAKEDIIVNNKVIYKAGVIVYKGSVLDDGNLVIDNLYLGDYCLINNETNEKKCFVLENTGDKAEVVESDFKFVKELNKGNITIFNSANNGEVIFGSVFEVIDAEGVIIHTGITNDAGIIKVDDLVMGKYCIKQKKVSENYQKKEEDICILLENNYEVKVVNDKIVNEIIKVPNTLQKI